MKGYDLSQLDILVADDCNQMRLILGTMLRSLGAKDVRLFSNGADAFEAFRQEPCDIMFTDWVMTPVNGLELLERVRTDPESPTPDVPVIMITSKTLSEDVVAARDAGVDGYLVKPINTETVYRRLVHVIDSVLEAA